MGGEGRGGERKGGEGEGKGKMGADCPLSEILNTPLLEGDQLLNVLSVFDLYQSSVTLRFCETDFSSLLPLLLLLWCKLLYCYKLRYLCTLLFCAVDDPGRQLAPSGEPKHHVSARNQPGSAVEGMSDLYRSILHRITLTLIMITPVTTFMVLTSREIH